MHKPLLILFTRAPAVHGGKTRLAREVGAVTAWQFQRRALAGLERQLRDSRWQLIRAITPDRRAESQDIVQQTGPFGQRLHRLLNRYRGRPVIIIGSDVPDLTAADIMPALQALRRPGFVLGPADDGGFWLIGRRGGRLSPRLFEGVRFSVPTTLRETMRRLPGRSTLIHMREDVDDGDSWQRYRQRR